MRTLFSVVVGLGLAAFPAWGQCSYSVSMWESFRAGQAIKQGAKQTAGDAFSFRRDGYSGPLLTAVQLTTGAPFAWGDPTQPFNVPAAGAIFSATPELSQNGFYDRLPGFTGIMLHPGYDNITCAAVFTAQTGMMVSSLHLYTEVIGDLSNGTQTTLHLVTAAGGVSTITGPITSLWGQPAQHTPILPINPFMLQPGDRFVIVSSNNGAPTEDWLNVELRLDVASAAPVIMAQPRGVAVCPGGTVTMRVTAAGAGGPGPLSGYQWQKDGADLPGETGPTLTVANAQEANGGRYRCVVRNTCGTNTSNYGTLLVRTADVGSTGGVSGSDGALDNNDFVVFIDRFFAGDARADYGATGGLPGPDGLLDNNDFITFIDLFFSGCQV